MRQSVIAFVSLFLAAGWVITANGDPRVFREAGITLRYPVNWFANNRPLNAITNPAQRVVLSSYRVRGDRPDFDGNYAPPEHGVIARVLEEMPPLKNGGSWPPRPHNFKLPRLGLMEGFGGNRWAELRFRENGRRFYIFIGIGRRASSAQIATLLRALRSMTITARL